MKTKVKVIWEVSTKSQWIYDQHLGGESMAKTVPENFISAKFTTSWASPVINTQRIRRVRMTFGSNDEAFRNQR